MGQLPIRTPLARAQHSRVKQSHTLDQSLTPSSRLGFTGWG